MNHHVLWLALILVFFQDYLGRHCGLLEGMRSLGFSSASGRNGAILDVRVSQ